MRTHYDPTITMKQARDQYFAANHFGDDGGYNADWVDFKLGPIPMPFPNTAARKRAVPFHDLHHILTGYQTTTTGEFEISAWEVGAGCKGHLFAWQINLGGLVAGIFSAPVRTWRAFVRGRNTDTFYKRSIEEMLAKTVQEARDMAKLNDEGREYKASILDALLFALAIGGGVIVGLLTVAMLLLAVPPLVIGNLLRSKRTA
jgi:hypothetical protein